MTPKQFWREPSTFDAIVLARKFVPLKPEARGWFKHEMEMGEPTISELVIRAEREGFRVGVAR
jgi:hypothetical protein